MKKRVLRRRVRQRMKLALKMAKKQNVLIGRGHFGKLFEVREGMEEEADSLRKEWRNKLKQK